MKKTSFTTLITALSTGLCLFAASPASMAANGASAANTVVVATDATFPPFEIEKDGKLSGFDIDMIRAIAKAEGLRIKLKTMPFDGIIPSLKVGSVDVAVAGITIKESRMGNVNFSNAYYKSGLSVLVRQGSKIKGFGDLKGHIVAAKKGTSSVDYLLSHGIESKYIKQFQNTTPLYQTLVTGGADAVLFDNPSNVNAKTHHKGLEVVGDLLTGEYYGIAVTKKKPKLLDKINDGLVKIKKNGVYDKLFDKYFAGDPHGKVKGVKTPSEVAVEKY